MYVISSYTKIQVNLKYILLNERNQSVRIHTLWLWLHDILEKAKLKIVNRSVITRAFNRWIIGEVFRAVELFCMTLMVVTDMQDSALIKNHQVVSACFKVWAAQVYYDPHISRWYGSKDSSCQCRRRKRHGFDSWVGKIPWRRKWQSTPVFLPGEFHGERSLVGYSSWGRKGSDTIEWLSTWQHTQSSSTETAIMWERPN